MKCVQSIRDIGLKNPFWRRSLEDEMHLPNHYTGLVIVCERTTDTSRTLSALFHWHSIKISRHNLLSSNRSAGKSEDVSSALKAASKLVIWSAIGCTVLLLCDVWGILRLTILSRSSCFTYCDLLVGLPPMNGDELIVIGKFPPVEAVRPKPIVLPWP